MEIIFFLIGVLAAALLMSIAYVYCGPHRVENAEERKKINKTLENTRAEKKKILEKLEKFVEKEKKFNETMEKSSKDLEGLKEQNKILQAQYQCSENDLKIISRKYESNIKKYRSTLIGIGRNIEKFDKDLASTERALGVGDSPVPGKNHTYRPKSQPNQEQVITQPQCDVINNLEAKIAELCNGIISNIDQSNKRLCKIKEKAIQCRNKSRELYMFFRPPNNRRLFNENFEMLPYLRKKDKRGADSSMQTKK